MLNARKSLDQYESKSAIAAEMATSANVGIVIPINSKLKTNNIPWFFSLERNGKISYLLGSCHVLPKEEINEMCLETIKKCSSIVIESIQPSIEEAIEYYTKTVLRDKSTDIWSDKLPENVREFFKKTVSIYYKKLGLHWELDDLKIWAAVEAAVLGSYALIKGAVEDDDMNIAMESDLTSSIFDNKFNGLETLSDLEATFKKMSESMQDLIDLYDEIQKTLINESNNEVDKYRKALELYEPIEIEETNSDKEMIIRNINWIPKIIKYHENLAGPIVFCVGGNHLLGEKGLLSLLPKLGFKIKRFSPNNSFEDYRYPFNSVEISSLILGQEKFMVSKTKRFNEDNVKASFLNSYQKFCQKGLLNKAGLASENVPIVVKKLK